MNKNFLAIAVAGFLGLAAFAGQSVFSGVEAQNNGKAPVILVVNMDQLVAQSKAGQSIPAQAQAVQASVRKELEDEAAKLQKDIENFQKNSELMSEEVRQKTGQELQARAQYGFPQRQQIAEQAFRMALQNAQAKILQESQPILEDLVKKRGATVLLDRAAVMYAAVETDVTQEVIAALDKKIDNVEVQQISVEEIVKQLREAAAAQAQAQAQANQ